MSKVILKSVPIISNPWLSLEHFFCLTFKLKSISHSKVTKWYQLSWEWSRSSAITNKPNKGSFNKRNSSDKKKDILKRKKNTNDPKSEREILTLIAEATTPINFRMLVRVKMYHPRHPRNKNLKLKQIQRIENWLKNHSKGKNLKNLHQNLNKRKIHINSKTIYKKCSWKGQFLIGLSQTLSKFL